MKSEGSVLYLKNHHYFKPVVLVVDDEPNNIKLLSQVLQEKYSIRVALNGEEALKRAEYEPLPDIILLDVMMPGMNGYEVCRRLKTNPKTEQIPILFVTAHSDEEDEAKGFELGAVDFLSKPISSFKVLARVKAHIALSNKEKSLKRTIDERSTELKATQSAAIHMLGEAGHYNDEDTGVHIWRMAAYSKALAMAYGWNDENSYNLELAAPMHDTGKIGIADSIIKSPGELSKEEWEVMKTHTVIGYKILSNNNTALFQLAAEIALYHHERWDGTGYPAGLKGYDIPESVRIVSICDVFDALTMKRAYQNPISTDEASSEIERQKGSQFDPELVDLFLKIKDKILKIKSEFKDEQDQIMRF